MSGTFELDISKFVEKAKGNLDQVIRRGAMDVFKRVVIKSPVDTGRFKSNWQLGVNSIPTGTIELSRNVSHDKEGKERDRGKPRSDPAENETLMRLATGIKVVKSGDVIWFVNNLSYARRLEYGHSGQAPSGMVRISILEWNNAVSKAAQSVR